MVASESQVFNNKTAESAPGHTAVSFDDASVTLFFSQQVCAGCRLVSNVLVSYVAPVHASAGKWSALIWKLYNAHASKQSLSVDTFAISCISMTEPPSPRLVSQRISNLRDDAAICEESAIRRGLLVAVYVEPFAAGQLGDESLVGVGVTVTI